MGAIAHEIGVAKSSVSLWVRDVPIPPNAVSVRTGRRLKQTEYFLTDEEAAALGMVRTQMVRLPIWRSGEAKQCGKCRCWLPLELFNRAGSGHQHWCRTCFKKYFQARGDVHRQQSLAAKNRRVGRLRRHVLRHLQSHPCLDCGEADPAVLEFDHVGQKKGCISALILEGADTDLIDSEIAQCEVVCANCHRIRTARRANWLRADPEWRERLPELFPGQAAKVRYVYELLAQSGCADCGNRRLECLDFDHLRDKNRGIAQMLRSSATVADLADEIAKCEVTCANCHRRRTVARRRPASA